jgi:acyl-CoA dehydrogenase-like protein
VPPTTSLSDGPAEARSFAESVAGVIGRQGPAGTGGWVPGAGFDDPWPELTASLDGLGWESLAHDDGLAPCAGLGALELGRGLASIHHVDRLVGGSPLACGLVRSVGAERLAVAVVDGAVVRRPIVSSEPCPSAEGLDVHRIVELGDAVAVDPGAWGVALGAWLAAGVGYLAGLGQGALDLTVDYVRQRRAFGSTLGALGPVQQLLAGAATAVRGVRLLAGEGPDADALAHAGPAVAEACAACQQVTGAIGFTLEYPLHRYTQRARSLATWNDALLDALLGR